MTITLRDIPSDLERALSAKARAAGKPVEQVAVEILAVATQTLSCAGKPDLSAIIGSWVDDPAFDQVRRDHEVITHGRGE